MRLTLPALAAGLLALAGIGRAQAPDEVFTRLKPYRTYLAVQGVTPTAHRFTAWFTHRGLMRVEAAGDTAEDFAGLTEDDLNWSSGGLAIPPDQVDPIPGTVADQAAALIERLNALFPGLSSLKVTYEGRFRQIRVEEITPVSAQRDPSETFVRRSNVSYYQSPGSPVLRPQGVQMFGGSAILCSEHFPADCAASPRFVDFVMPPRLEGSSILISRATSQEVGPEYEAAWTHAAARISAAADALEDETYVNPIESILARQPGGLLPPGMESYVDISLSAYARARDFQQQVGEHPRFRFPVRASLAETQRRTWTSPATGLTYAMSLSLATRLVRLTVKTPAGDQVTVDGAVEPNHLGGLFIEDGETAALADGYLPITYKDRGSRGLSLPGTGGFTRFDLYPDESMRVAPLHRPANPGDGWKDEGSAD